MKKIPIILLFVCFFLQTHAQNTYEKGYFITNENDTVNCFLRIPLNHENPTKCKYKLTKDSKVEYKTIDEVKEFVCPGIFKFRRATVMMDSFYVEQLWGFGNVNPTLKEYTVFLQVLVEGKASLFEYTTEWLDIFLFSVSNDSIKQFIFKEYLYDEGEDGYYINRQYQRQLQSELNCKTGQDFNVKYTYSNLIRIVKEFNACNNTESKTFFVTSEPVKTNFKFYSGVNLFESKLILPNVTKKFPRFYSPNFSFEIESFISKSMNFSFVAQPSLLLINNEYDTYEFKGKLCFNQISLPLGVRYYLLNNKTKMFVSLFANPAIGINFNSSIQRYPINMNRKILIDSTPMYEFESGVSRHKFSCSISYSVYNVRYRNTDIYKVENVSLKFGYRIN